MKFKVEKEESRFILVLYNQDGDRKHYSLNDYAKDLFISPIKVINTLKKDYDAIIERKNVYRYGGYKELSYAHFITENNANRAADWLSSILLSNEMKGAEELKQEKHDKQQASYEKRVLKKFQQTNPFIGQKVEVDINFSADYTISGNVRLHTKIINISRSGTDRIFIETLDGSFQATYSSFYFGDEVMTLLNGGQKVKFEIEIEIE